MIVPTGKATVEFGGTVQVVADVEFICTQQPRSARVSV
jgi:hypothetical protein